MSGKNIKKSILIIFKEELKSYKILNIILIIITKTNKKKLKN